MSDLTTGPARSRPVDAATQALWMLQRLVPGTGVSNVAVAIEMSEPPRWWPLREVLTWLARRHPAFGAEFVLHGGAVCRRDATPSLDLDIAGSTPDRIETDLAAYAARPFRLDRAPLARAGLFTVGPDLWVLCLAAHHIVVDAASLGRLVAEIGQAYRAITETGEPPSLPAPVDVAATDDDGALDYWRNQVKGVDPLAMRLDGARETPATPTFAGRMVERELSAEAVRGVATLRRTCRSTDALVLLACYHLLLRRLGAGCDQVVGVITDRRGGRAADAVGYHVATVPLRVRVDDDIGFDRLVERVTEAMTAGLEQGSAPFEAVAAASGQADADGPAWWRSRLVRHLFNFRPEPPTTRPVGDRSVFREVATGLSRFDLELTFQPVGDRIGVKLIVSTEVHDGAEFGEVFLDRLDMVIRSAVAHPSRRVGEFDVRTRWDRSVQEAANATAMSWQGPATMLELFDAAAARPAEIALVDGPDAVTYRELSRRAAAYQAALVAAGGGPGTVVALAHPRGRETAAAVLGVWRAGAAYLPLDPGHPAERLAYQLDDAGCRLVIGAEHLPARCRAGRVAVTPADDPGDRTPDVAVPDGCAYLIYTSGSTGRPKGVRLTHRNLANVVNHFVRELGLGSQTAMLWLTTFAFDISVLELCLPLAVGGRVVTAPDSARADAKRLAHLVRTEDVSVVQATPTTWRTAAGELAGELKGRVVLCGGEPLPEPLAGRLLRTGAAVYNVYGPTETTIWSTAARLRPGEPVTVGKPIANTRVHILDEVGRPLPVGRTGELCIAGDGVADGYHERPGLTAERFRHQAGLGRYYRTGDLARLCPDGAVELAGRADGQIKLRGHRIELGEVAAVLEEGPEVSAVAVIVKGDPSADGFIAAFVVAEDRPGLAARVWERAARVLPGYSVPSRILVLDRLPATANGKVDLVALAAIEIDTPDEAEPVRGGEEADPVEAALIELWASVLRRGGTGRDSNFFLSGGNSLRAVQLAEAATVRCGVEVTMAMIFRAPTPAGLAELVRQAGGTAAAELVQPEPVQPEPVPPEPVPPEPAASTPEDGWTAEARRDLRARIRGQRG